MGIARISLSSVLVVIVVASSAAVGVGVQPADAAEQHTMVWQSCQPTPIGPTPQGIPTTLSFPHTAEAGESFEVVVTTQLAEIIGNTVVITGSDSVWQMPPEVTVNDVTFSGGTSGNPQYNNGQTSQWVSTAKIQPTLQEILDVNEWLLGAPAEDNPYGNGPVESAVPPGWSPDARTVLVQHTPETPLMPVGPNPNGFAGRPQPPSIHFHLTVDDDAPQTYLEWLPPLDMHSVVSDTPYGATNTHCPLLYCPPGTGGDCNPQNFVLGSTLVDGVPGPPIPVEGPEAPTNVIAAGAGAMAQVTWNASEAPPGDPISSYVVKTLPVGPSVRVAPGVTSADVIGLSPGETVAFVVVAETELGRLATSAQSNLTSILEPKDFFDVGLGDPFVHEIEWMAARGLSTGFEDGTYRPSATLTRQAMSAFLYRLSGSTLGPNPPCDEAPFPDVSIGHPFCGEISWMKGTGITAGYDDGTFKPELGLARQAMSAFLFRSAHPGAGAPPCTSAPFSDVVLSDKFCPEIAWMAQTGISAGHEDGTFRPGEPLTRQAMSAFLYRYTLAVPTSFG